MFTITVQTSFTARHQLTLLDGTLEPLHEHEFKVIVAVSSDRLDRTGCVMDFHWLSSIIEGTLAPLKNTKLEDVDFFAAAGSNASAECIAKFIYDSISPDLPDNVDLRYVNIMEAPDCWAKYEK